MKPLVCIYCEGNDTKIAVINKDSETDKVKVLRTASISGGELVTIKIRASNGKPKSLLVRM